MRRVAKQWRRVSRLGIGLRRGGAYRVLVHLMIVRETMSITFLETLSPGGMGSGPGPRSVKLLLTKNHALTRLFNTPACGSRSGNKHANVCACMAAFAYGWVALGSGVTRASACE